jgi:hypothetical protein
MKRGRRQEIHRVVTCLDTLAIMLLLGVCVTLWIGAACVQQSGYGIE